MADATKTKKTKAADLTKTFERMLDASVELVGGTLEAVAAGINEFGTHAKDTGNLTKLGGENSLVKGLFKGAARTLQDAPDLLTNAHGAMVPDSPAGPAEKVPAQARPQDAPPQ